MGHQRPLRVPHHRCCHPQPSLTPCPMPGHMTKWWLVSVPLPLGLESSVLGTRLGESHNLRTCLEQMPDQQAGYLGSLQLGVE